MNYSTTADELSSRIEALMDKEPSIMRMIDPFELYKIPGFKCDDLEPSLFQAQWALRKAQERYAKRTK